MASYSGYNSYFDGHINTGTLATKRTILMIYVKYLLVILDVVLLIVNVVNLLVNVLIKFAK